MTAAPSFAEFLARLRQGDDTAARLLVERFGRRLLSMAQVRLDQRLRGKVEPDDVVQSALKSLCVRLRQGQFEIDDWGSLQALLITITVRKCGRWRDYYFAQQRDVSRERSLPAGEDQPAGTAEPADREPDPADVLILEETASAMVRGLSEEERQFVRLRLEGYKTREISERLNCTYDRVWRTLRLVQGRLKRMLDAGGLPA
jgi:RNA polymerase sigma factor (sigma-70 family)